MSTGPVATAATAPATAIFDPSASTTANFKLSALVSALFGPADSSTETAYPHVELNGLSLDQQVFVRQRNGNHAEHDIN